MTEAWLEGPVAGVPALLMPAAHAWLQVGREVPVLLEGLSRDQIWARPGESAPMGFHAVHLAGATDRLLTYARGEALTAAQLEAARGERELSGLDAATLVRRVDEAMTRAIAFVRTVSDEMLIEPREVGRQRLPSTVLGLVFHAAEHASRHAGQMATLRKIVAAAR